MIVYTFSRIDTLVLFAKARSLRGPYDGRDTIATLALLRLCTHHYRINQELSATIIFTRDIGYHTSGWWKNPDYERCLHLSLSFTGGGEPLPFDRRRGAMIVHAFFDDDARLAWIEGPHSPEGKARAVWHYRVFCDAGWQPMLPRGEVYGRELTEAGWQSFSDIHNDALRE